MRADTVVDERGTTDFGYERIPVTEKKRRVGHVFDSVADRYDVMNDLMSFGLHRLWKRQALALAGIRRGQQVLDLASGTGDLALALARQVGPRGHVIASDINLSMLSLGRDRLIDAGAGSTVDAVLADAEKLPFPDRSFDRVTIAFGLRNVTDKAAALAEMRRVLRPGGMVMVLEFSSVRIAPLRPLYDAYSFRLLPLMGRLVANDADSYRYLAESIRMHPDQERLCELMTAAGLEDCNWHNLAGGIVAVHRGYVY
jgi:demethylmenaquinone methyltransferase/2-methoxy-6-polyprenyl-1,4-benzoquinol methylase